MTTHRFDGFVLPEEGELSSVSVAGRSIVITVVGSETYAFDEHCTHAQCSLLEGEVEGKTVVCPCHLGQFDLSSGEVLAGPPLVPLRTYPVRFYGRSLELDVQP